MTDDRLPTEPEGWEAGYEADRYDEGCPFCSGEPRYCACITTTNPFQEALDGPLV